MFPNHTITTPSWSFDIHPGKGDGNDTTVFSGTVQHAMAQMEAAYPGWRKEFDSYIDNQEQDIRKRDNSWKEYWRQPIDCDRDEATEPEDDRFEWALTSAIQVGIRYLDHLQFKGIHLGQGPKCSRVSCSYNSAIFACNADPDDVTLSSWSKVSDGAWMIMDACHFDVPYKRYYCKGEATHEWHDSRRPWYVIVRGLKEGHEIDGDDRC